jgi:hypothetical protein
LSRIEAEVRAAPVDTIEVEAGLRGVEGAWGNRAAATLLQRLLLVGWALLHRNRGSCQIPPLSFDAFSSS